jgi:hypothetical protein
MIWAYLTVVVMRKTGLSTYIKLRNVHPILLACHAPRSYMHTLPTPSPETNSLIGNPVLRFPEKKQKAVVLLRRRRWAARTSAKPTLGVWGLAPKDQVVVQVYGELVQ